MDIEKHTIIGYSHSFRITCKNRAVSLLENGEQHHIKAINNNINTVQDNSHIPGPTSSSGLRVA